MKKALIAILLTTSVMFTGCTSKDMNDATNNLNNTSTTQNDNSTTDTNGGGNVNVDTNVTTA
jgi:major membrane immunogen (membrane-anchored lipoprotein)